MGISESRFTWPRRVNLQAGDTNTIRAQLLTGASAWATPSNVRRVVATVYRQSAASNPVDQRQLVVSDVILSPPVTDDPLWLDDTNDDRTRKGYNFRWRIPVAVVPVAGWYTIEIHAQDTANRVQRLVFEGPARGALTTPTTLPLLGAASSSSSSSS